MAGYIRQSSFSDGDTITAALFNNEYNQILNAFSNTSGHAHDGTAAEGPVIGLIGDAGETAPNNKVLIDTTNNFIEFYVQVSSSPVQQLYIADGAIIPVTDNDIDLGTSSLEFKDGYFDGTLYADAINFNGTAITSTAAELNILDGVTASATDINLIDGITNGTVIASKAIITDSNKDITGGRNITISGELDAATLDISGDADIDGTLEADAITIAGVTLAETISDTVGAMVSSNTETNITVTYDDSDNTLDFVLPASLEITTAVGIGGGSTNGVQISQGAIAIKNGGSKSYIDLYCESSNAHYTRIEAAAHSAYSGNVTATLPVTTGTLAITSEIPTTEEIQDIVGAMVSSNTETNITVTYQDSDGTIDFVVDAAQPNVTSLGTLTSLTVDDVFINGSTIGHTSDTDLMTVASGILTVAGEVSMTTLDIGGTNVTSTAAELNILDGVTSTAAELNILDGVTSTAAELNILDGVTASAADINLIDGITNGTVIASKAIITDANKDITGGRNITISGELDAASLDISGDADIDGTLEADAITIGGVTLAETISDTVGAMVTSNTESGITVAYQDADNTLDFTIGTLNQDTTGTAATVTGAAQSNITSLGTLTTLTVDNVIINGTTIGHTDDTDLMTLADGVLTVAGEVDAVSLDVSGDIDVDGTTNLDVTDIDGTLNVAGVVTAQTSANLSEVALTDGTVAWDAAAAANATLLLEENSTISAPSNAVAGAIISIEVAQHATSGPYTLAWNTVFEFAASTAPTMTATDAKTDIFSFRYNGSVWQEIGRVQNMAQT